MAAEGGQAEVVLKVQQGENPNFGFLFEKHVQHPYYKWLCRNPMVRGLCCRSAVSAVASSQAADRGSQARSDAVEGREPKHSLGASHSEVQKKPVKDSVQDEKKVKTEYNR